MIFSTAQMLGLQALRIRSAYIFAGITSIMLSGVLVRGIVGKGVWKFFIPFTLLVGASVEAVTSVCLHSNSSWSQPLISVTRHIHSPDWSNGQRRSVRNHHCYSFGRCRIYHGSTNRTPLSSNTPPESASDSGRHRVCSGCDCPIHGQSGLVAV
jgi:hypothetical protein